MKEDALKQLFGAMPTMQEMKALESGMKSLTLLFSLLPPMEIKEVERKIYDPKDKTKVLAVKKYVAIYIEKPEKAKP